MATAGKDLSSNVPLHFENVHSWKIGLVVAEWNQQITGNLEMGAVDALLEQGVLSENIHRFIVPGAFELPLGCQWLFEKTNVDGIIAIGCVIQGETRHFDFVCNGATNGIQDVMLKYSLPISFCLLTDQNEQQSIDRSGGKHGNKGIECAVACLKMIALRKGFG